MKRRLSFQVKLFLALVCFSCLLLVLLGTILFHFIDRQLHHDLGQRARVQAQGFDARFQRTWEFYLAYCEAGFDARSIDVVQYTLIKD